MGSDAAEVQRTAAAVVRALKAWPGTHVGDVSDPVPNRRGSGCRVYIEVLAHPDATTDTGVEVTVERADTRPARPARRELS